MQRLGAGGMGVVYRAEDTRLGRPVALKVIGDELLKDPQAIERFQREARSASALNHPNICTIYEVDEVDGSPFLVMELLEGRTLKERLEDGPLGDDVLIDIAIEFADALATAHEARIIHRDLKPANLFLTRLGHLKILDFGLAKVLTQQRDDSIAPTAARDLTASDTTLGTVAYMSPEQARGEPLDARTDLFSFGAVLYEMATGQRAFAANTTAMTYDAILHTDPPPMAPRHAALEAIVQKALEKDRELRYQSAADIRADLKRLKHDSAPTARTGSRRPKVGGRRAGALAAILAAGVLAVFGATALWRTRSAPSLAKAKLTTIAVLPFANLGRGTERDYLRMAVPDELITILSRSPALAVRPFAMTRRFTGDVDPQATGKTLSVANVITGSYREAAGRVELTVETIDVERNNVVWRDSLAVPAEDQIAMRNELSRRIRRDLLPRLNAASGATDPNTPGNDDAYDLFLKATAMSTDPGPNKTALEMLERAVALDPSYAPAWMNLGWRSYNEYQYNSGGMGALERGRSAHMKALTLDPDLMQSRRAIVVLRTETGDLPGAYQEATNLVRRRPESGDAHFALSYTLRYAGLAEEAGRECDKARSLDPTNASFRSCSLTFLLAGDEQKANDYIQLEAGSAWANNMLMHMRMRRGDLAGAAKVATDTKLPVDQWGVLKAHQERVKPSQLDEEVARLKQFVLAVHDGEPSYVSAEALAVLDRRTDAIELLRAAAARNYCAFPAIDRSPAFASIRNTPEYRQIRESLRQCQVRFVEWRAKNAP